MDLNRALADHQIATKMKEADEAGIRILLVCPANGELPDDGFLTYSAGADVKALLAAPDGGVIVFDESHSRLLKMIIEYQDEFTCRVKVLEGVPNVNYGPWFSSATWSQDKVSYAGLLSEMSIAESAMEKDDGSKTIYERESDQFTRANGTVKDQDNFRLAGDHEDEGETY